MPNRGHGLGALGPGASTHPFLQGHLQRVQSAGSGASDPSSSQQEPEQGGLLCLRREEKLPFRLSPRSHGVPSGPRCAPWACSCYAARGLAGDKHPQSPPSESTRAPRDAQALRGSCGSSAPFQEDPPARTRRKWARMTPGCPGLPPGHGPPRAPGGSVAPGPDEQRRPGRSPEWGAQLDLQPESGFANLTHSRTLSYSSLNRLRNRTTFPQEGKSQESTEQAWTRFEASALHHRSPSQEPTRRLSNRGPDCADAPDKGFVFWKLKTVRSVEGYPTGARPGAAAQERSALEALLPSTEQGPRGEGGASRSGRGNVRLVPGLGLLGAWEGPMGTTIALLPGC